MRASINTYNPDCPIFVYRPEPSTFGECYNGALADAFKTHDAVIVANDDIVVTPTSINALMEDVDALKIRHGNKLGLVAALSDDARNSQNIRFEAGKEWKERSAVSPIFAWMSKAAFDAVQFPPINWYSDDVLCEDLNRLGFVHYISRAYVHHVGSQTVGRDYAKLNAEALPWLRANRPDYVRQWWGDQWL